MIALLAAGILFLVQGQGPQLEATVDFDRVSVGEELTYTLRAVSHSPAPMQVTVAPFNGLELLGRSESTELALGDATTRTTILEIRLRAVRTGRWTLGPAKAVQGGDTVDAAPITVDVAADRAAMASELNPRLGNWSIAPRRPPQDSRASISSSRATPRGSESRWTW